MRNNRTLASHIFAVSTVFVACAVRRTLLLPFQRMHHPLYAHSTPSHVEAWRTRARLHRSYQLCRSLNVRLRSSESLGFVNNSPRTAPAFRGAQCGCPYTVAVATVGPTQPHFAASSHTSSSHVNNKYRFVWNDTLVRPLLRAPLLHASSVPTSSPIQDPNLPVRNRSSRHTALVFPTLYILRTQ